jgi:Domain of unknown function (DUF4760)
MQSAWSTFLLSTQVADGLVSRIWNWLFPHDVTPHWADRWTGVGTVGLWLSAVMAALFTVQQIRQARRIEQSQTFLELMRRWNDPVFRRARIRIREYYDVRDNYYDRFKKDTPEQKALAVKVQLLQLRRTNKESYWECLEALNFFETVAVLIKQDAITFKTINDLWGFILWDYWAILHLFVKHQRKQDPVDEKYCIEFQKLVEKRITKKNHYETPWVSSDAHGPGSGR